MSSPSSPFPIVEPSRARGVRSREAIEIGPPSDLHSGLFPAVKELPRAPDSVGIRLRRAVLMIVVLGGVSLLAYASWQRLDHARAMRSGEVSTGALGHP